MMNPQTMQLNEKIDYILAGKDLQERAGRAEDIATKDVTFAPFMTMASLQEQKFEGLPDGMPDTYKPETDIPDGVADSTARQEFRRIKNFLPGGTMSTLPRTHRESVWFNLLQGLHHKEAKILIMIKDQTLFTEYPELRNVLVALQVQVNVPPTDSKPKAKKTPKPK